jgi:D-3-phosphoglycerate dehydrogenase / 2-oxoglutarate reductase
VGCAVRDLAATFGMRVLATGRRAGPQGFLPRPLDALLAESDFLVVCCPLTEATRGLIGAAQLARMPPHAVLVNVARGAVVDEAALLAALRERRIGGAALDVFATQPLSPQHPFFALDNVLLTPHLAGITEASMRRMGLGAVAEVARAFVGEPPANLVNPGALPHWRTRWRIASG